MREGRGRDEGGTVREEGKEERRGGGGGGGGGGGDEERIKEGVGRILLPD